MAIVLKFATLIVLPMESCLNTQNKTQVDRFKEAARQLEANDDEAVFNAKLGKLVKQKPAQEVGKKDS